MAVMKVSGQAVVRSYELEYEEYVRKSLAHDLVDLIFRSGHITFTKDKPDEGTMTETIRATIGIVSAATVASMEERIAERQMELASKLVGAAAEEIRVWDSYYTGDGGNISKGQAVDAVSRAFKKLSGAA
ncbi:hypothetical protein [Mesorhizobium sp. M1B.F.Ca.ET.045.04.1.1]|uniref:hypothetical protein n=1 Tax=Mesorhizobium sp. M1B.F.Ca.ET.045.04.1.1 TaxID=2493673 RepID=UPI000F762DD5|nr:hypothetical protein [Mesorhizobium sp. M1B.F.Ca.ET.045.04.1.1]AZO29390.1 hypothetical protein EJ071_19685 [Mesorhizobium sp. M1B.F.Ca.ET.045.04.1.1]